MLLQTGTPVSSDNNPEPAQTTAVMTTTPQATDPTASAVLQEVSPRDLADTLGADATAVAAAQPADDILTPTPLLLDPPGTHLDDPRVKPAAFGKDLIASAKKVSF
jgi:hypothetical protein